MKIKFLILLLTVCNAWHAQTGNIKEHSLEKRTYKEMEQDFYSGGAEDLNSKDILQNIILRKPELKRILLRLQKHMLCCILISLYRLP
jgi:hypothetical protein